MKSTSSSCMKVAPWYVEWVIEEGCVHAVGLTSERPSGSRRPRERHMGRSAGRGGGLDLIVLLEALQPLPQARASAEQDRDHHDVHVVHKPRSEEVADHCGASTDAQVLPVRSLQSALERLGGRHVAEVQRRAAPHLNRRARVMGEDEDRCVERRGGAPPPPPPPPPLPSPVTRP